MKHIWDFLCAHPLTRDAPLKAALRVLNWQVISRIRHEISIPWVQGTKLIARNGMVAATGNYYVGLMEFADMAFVLHFLREDDVFVDVGANIGSFTVLASGVCHARSISFEPDPTTVEFLRRNISINGLGRHVIVHQSAVGAANGVVRFSIGGDAVNKVVADGTAVSREVQVVSIDSLLNDVSPSLIKIDVEGYEEQVLEGASVMFSHPSLKAVEIETVSERSRMLLAAHGFKRWYYDVFNRVLTEEPVVYGASNALFVRDVEFVRERLSSAQKIKVLDHFI